MEFNSRLKSVGVNLSGIKLTSVTDVSANGKTFVGSMTVDPAMTPVRGATYIITYDDTAG
jgi:hypothetical protein